MCSRSRSAGRSCCSGTPGCTTSGSPRGTRTTSGSWSRRTTSCRSPSRSCLRLVRRLRAVRRDRRQRLRRGQEVVLLRRGPEPARSSRRTPTRATTASSAPTASTRCGRGSAVCPSGSSRRARRPPAGSPTGCPPRPERPGDRRAQRARAQARVRARPPERRTSRSGSRASRTSTARSRSRPRTARPAGCAGCWYEYGSGSTTVIGGASSSHRLDVSVDEDVVGLPEPR